MLNIQKTISLIKKAVNYDCNVLDIANPAMSKSKELLKKGISFEIFPGLLAYVMNASDYTPKIFEFYLKNGADVNGKDDSGKYPLHKAVSHCSPSYTKLLLEYGADINLTCNMGNKAMHYLINGKLRDDYKVEVLKMLLDGGINYNSIYRSIPLLSRLIIADLTEGVRILPKDVFVLDKINKIDDAGKFSLYYAIENKNIEIIELLLQKGADPNIISLNDGLLLALTLSDMNPRIDIIELLLKYHANPLLKNKQGVTFLDCCDENKNPTSIWWSSSDKEKIAELRENIKNTYLYQTAMQSDVVFSI